MGNNAPMGTMEVLTLRCRARSMVCARSRHGVWHLNGFVLVPEFYRDYTPVRQTNGPGSEDGTPGNATHRWGVGARGTSDNPKATWIQARTTSPARGRYSAYRSVSIRGAASYPARFARKPAVRCRRRSAGFPGPKSRPVSPGPVPTQSRTWGSPTRTGSCPRPRDR